MKTLAKLIATTALICSGALAETPQPSVALSVPSLLACSNAGVAECQFKLAQLTEVGSGVKQDLGVAKALYEKAYAGGVESAGASLLRLMRNQPTAASAEKPVGSAPEAKSKDVVEAKHVSGQTPVTIAGMSYGASGLPLGFEHTSFEQTEVEFGRQFSASECVHFGGGSVRCDATFKGSVGTVRIGAFFRSGRMFSMAQLIPRGCAAQSAEFSKRMIGENAENTAFMAAFFLPSGIYNLSRNAVISAWSGNDTLHGITACERNDSGMVLLSRESLNGAEEAARQRAARAR